MKTEIVYEDEYLMICRKPAGLATQSASIGRMDVISELKNYLAKKDGKEPYLGVIHRLDQPVEGLLVFAKNQKIAASLTKQLTEKELHKCYFAVSYNQPYAEEGILEDYMIKDASTRMAKIVTADIKGAKKAVLHYKCIERKNNKVLYAVNIETGRFHQIRAQMAHAGMALLGDQKYADEITKQYSQNEKIKNVGLCACELSIIHPITKEKMSFVIQPEGEAFKDFYD